MRRYVRGRDVNVGDDLGFGFVVKEFRPYVGALTDCGGIRVAVSLHGTTMTVFDGALMAVES